MWAWVGSVGVCGGGVGAKFTGGGSGTREGQAAGWPGTLPVQDFLEGVGLPGELAAANRTARGEREQVSRSIRFRMRGGSGSLRGQSRCAPPLLPPGAAAATSPCAAQARRLGWAKAAPHRTPRGAGAALVDSASPRPVALHPPRPLAHRPAPPPPPPPPVDAGPARFPLSYVFILGPRGQGPSPPAPHPANPRNSRARRLGRGLERPPRKVGPRQPGLQPLRVRGWDSRRGSCTRCPIAARTRRPDDLAVSPTPPQFPLRCSHQGHRGRGRGESPRERPRPASWEPIGRRHPGGVSRGAAVGGPGAGPEGGGGPGSERGRGGASGPPPREPRALRAGPGGRGAARAAGARLAQAREAAPGMGWGRGGPTAGAAGGGGGGGR